MVTNNIHVSQLRKRSNFTFKYTQLKEQIISDHIGFYFPWNHFLHEAFDRKLGQMIESGITKKLVDEASFMRVQSTDDYEPLVLTMDHLDVVFQLWLAGLLTSTLEFLLESFIFNVTLRITFRKLMKFRKIIILSTKYY